MRRSSAKTMVAIQALAATVALVALTMWPPASGAMLLVPLPGGDADAMATAATAAGAVLLGRGPLPGSMVVIGDRHRIAGRIGRGRAVIMAAPPSGCGFASAGGIAA